MEQIDHELDPGGDTVLVLRNANAPFAVWDDSLRWPDASVPGFNASAAPIAVAQSFFKNDAKATDTSVKTAEAPVPKGPEIRLKLSSRHLILASPYFKSMFEGPWKENSPDNNFRYRASAEDWEEDALLIVMNIIHGHVGKVPRKLDLERLAKVAVIVDYYQCHEVVVLFSDVWIANLDADSSVPKKYGRDLILRFFVSWVFAEKTTFETTAIWIAKNARGPLHTLDLPIPAAVTGNIEFRRQDLLHSIIASTYNTFNSLSKEDCSRSCSDDCSSMYLGALTKQMLAAKLLSPKPNAPFLGFSHDSIVRRIAGLWHPTSKVHGVLNAAEMVRRKQAKLEELLRPLTQTGIQTHSYNTHQDSGEMSVQILQKFMEPWEDEGECKLHIAVLHQLRDKVMSNNILPLHSLELSHFQPTRSVAAVDRDLPKRITSQGSK